MRWFWRGSFQSPWTEPIPDNLYLSIQAMEMDALLAVAHHPISSRVLDVALESSTVPAKFKRKFILIFLGHYHELVDDRIGSRVGERCWAHADPYLKVSVTHYM